jgi:hypothetical protein
MMGWLSWPWSLDKRQTTAAASDAKTDVLGVAASDGQGPWDPASKGKPAKAGASNRDGPEAARSRAAA